MRPLQKYAMRAHGAGVATVRTSVNTIVVAITLSLGLCSTALAAAPAPCGGVVQISDDSGDGHHENTDVLSAWFSEQAGRLQAVIKVNLGDWRPMHVDSDAAGWAVLFEVAGQSRFVRIQTPKSGPIRYDYGTWTLAGGFVSAGATNGEVTTGSGGTATIDVPAESGAVPGALLARPFVLTYEGASASAPHWVDRGPGGVTPSEAAFGADYVVGSCPGSAAAGSGAGAGESPVGGGTAGAGAATTAAVVLDAPKRRVGAGRVRASGRVVPARGGVTVLVTAKARRCTKAPFVRSVKTLPNGSFAISIPLAESSTVTAAAEGINAQTRTITVRSKVRMTLRRMASGKTVATGWVSPRLPGRVLLLRTNAAVPSATTRVRRGGFRFAARRLIRGRYQAVFIPSGNRAERSTSASGAVR
ncbi:MAG: hypothetical protein ACR2H2_04560 [Solirubrobacteraceae bacterium]